MTQQSNATVYSAPIRKLQSACKRKCPHCNGIAVKIAQVGEFSSLTCNKKTCKDAACNCVGRQVQKRQNEEAEAKWKREQRLKKKAEDEAKNGKGINLNELAHRI